MSVFSIIKSANKTLLLVNIVGLLFRGMPLVIHSTTQCHPSSLLGLAWVSVNLPLIWTPWTRQLPWLAYISTVNLSGLSTGWSHNNKNKHKRVHKLEKGGVHEDGCSLLSNCLKSNVNVCHGRIRLWMRIVKAALSSFPVTQTSEVRDFLKK